MHWKHLAGSPVMVGMAHSMRHWWHGGGLGLGTKTKTRSLLVMRVWHWGIWVKEVQSIEYASQISDFIIPDAQRPLYCQPCLYGSASAGTQRAHSVVNQVRPLLRHHKTMAMEYITLEAILGGCDGLSNARDIMIGTVGRWLAQMSLASATQQV